MPRKPPTRKSKARRPLRRVVKYVAKAKASLPKSLVPFPRTRMVKLRYVTNIDLDASAGSVSTWGFRSNSIYDPNYSSGTTPTPKPYYTDQMFASYNKATVVGSKISIIPFGAAATGSYVIAGIYRDDDTTARAANLAEVLEKPGTVWRGIGDANQQPRTMSMTYSAKKTHGGKPLSNTSLQCSATADPTDSDFFRVFVGCPTAATDPGQVTFMVRIEYTVVFTDRIEPDTSL